MLVNETTDVGESMNGWMVQKLIEERQRDLLVHAHRTHLVQEREVLADMSLPASEVAPRLRVMEPDTHRPLGQMVGEWLIRAGVKLGGASIQAS